MLDMAARGYLSQLEQSRRVAATVAAEAAAKLPPPSLEEEIGKLPRDVDTAAQG